jgi:hypothetical protein
MENNIVYENIKTRYDLLRWISQYQLEWNREDDFRNKVTVALLKIKIFELETPKEAGR